MINTFLKIMKSNTVFRVILTVELLVLFWMGVNCLRTRCDYSFSTENLYAANADYVSIVTGEDGQAGYCLVSEEEVEEESVLYTEKFTLYPGAYRITVSYVSQVNYMEEADIDVGLSYLNLSSGQQGYYCQFESMLLRDGTDCVEQTLQVTSPGKLSSIQLSLDFYGQGEVTVYSIELTEICAYRYLSFLGWFLIFAGFDVLFFLLFTSYRYHYARELGVLVVICLAGILPFLADWSIMGHDTLFHVARIRYLAYELAHGNYFPPIYSAAWNHYGYSTPLFYGQLFLYIPAILYNCGFSLTFAYNFYLIMMTVAACLIMYYCALKILGKTSSALLASALYTFSAHRLTDVLTRAAFGEFTAMAFLPLLVLGFYNIYTVPKGEKITIQSYWPIILGFTCIAGSHTLTMFMSAIVIFLFCLIFIKKTLEPKRFVALVRAAGLTFLVNLGILVMMIDSMGMNLRVDQLTNYIQGGAAYPLQLLNAVVNNYQEYTLDGSASNELSLSVGFSITLGLLLFLVWAARKKEGRKEERNRDVFMSVCWGFSVLALFLSSVYMIYDYMAFLPKALYYLFSVYEFAWRWLTYASLFGAFCTAAVADREEVSALFRPVSVQFILCMILVINTGQIYSDQLLTSDLHRFTNNLYESYGLDGGDEFFIYGTNTNLLSVRYMIYDEEELQVESYVYENGEWLLTVENLTDHVAGIHLPLLNYDHYAARETETGETIEHGTGHNYQVYLYIPAGYSGTIAVRYRLPVYWKLAIAISVVTDAALMIYICWGRRKGRVPVTGQGGRK